MSLRTAIAERLRKMIGMPGTDKVALVLDPDTFDIFKDYLGEPDSWKVACHYMADQPPAPSQISYAVYFVSIAHRTHILQDIQTQKTYAKVWVFFRDSPSHHFDQALDDLVNMKQNAVARGGPRKVMEVEFNVLNFGVLDSRTATTGHKDAFLGFNGERKLWVTALMNNVASVVATLGEKPVYYYATDSPLGLPKFAVDELQELLSDKRHNCLSTKISDHQLRPEGTADLVILDRSIDPVAPFVLELGYEALMRDVLGDMVGKYGAMKLDAEGRPEPVQQQVEVLSDSNPTWVEIRHQHFQDVTGLLNKEVDRIEEQGAKVKAAVLNLKQDKVSKGLKELQDLPRRKQINNSLVGLYRAVKAQVDSRVLMPIAQEMEAVLIKDDADVEAFVKRALESPATSTGRLYKQDVTRLLVCCIAGSRGVLDEKFLTAWMQFGVNADHVATIIHNLGPMGVSATKTSNGSWVITTLQKNQIPRPPPLVPQDWSRRTGQFESYLSNIIQQTAAETLPESRFQKWAAHLPRQGTLRIGFDWTKRTLTQGDVSSNTRRLIVVLLGGATWGEVRQCHQLSLQLKRDIVLITNAVLTPREWMRIVDPQYSEPLS